MEDMGALTLYVDTFCFEFSVCHMYIGVDFIYATAWIKFLLFCHVNFSIIMII